MSLLNQEMGLYDDSISNELNLGNSYFKEEKKNILISSNLVGNCTKKLTQVFQYYYYDKYAHIIQVYIHD